MSASETKKAVLLRVKARPSFEVVPEHAIALFDHIIERDEAEAHRLHPGPDGVWDRVEFWKDRVLDAVLSKKRGVIAVYFHEYMAALMRGENVEVGTDPYGFDDLPAYGGEARAQRDAYLACTASLA